MTAGTDVNRIRDWIDGDLVTNVERIQDEAAEFNLTIEISNILVHIIRRHPDGPLLLGQQIEYGTDIQSHIQAMSDPDRSELIMRIRETLTSIPVVYGFHDMNGKNVRFQNMYRVFLEHRIYPNSIDQQTLMNGLIDVWKAMRYLDDLVTLIDAVEN